MATYNDIQLIKREFFSLRNGIIADTIRRSGAPYKIIFGLNMPQLKEIADAIGPNRALADALHANATTRESLMLAPMIFPHGEMTPQIAAQWIADSPTAEVIDVTCHRLLRHLPFAAETAREFAVSDSDMLRYAALRLLLNLRDFPADEAAGIARAELARAVPLTAGVARMLLERLEED